MVTRLKEIFNQEFVPKRHKFGDGIPSERFGMEERLNKNAYSTY